MYRSGQIDELKKIKFNKAYELSRRYYSEISKPMKSKGNVKTINVKPNNAVYNPEKYRNRMVKSKMKI
jgi:hypothetical protein